MLRIFALNKKRTRKDRWDSIKLNTARLIAPLVIAILATAIWWLCEWRGWYLPQKAEGMLGTATLVLAAIFAVAAALFLTGTWEHYQMIARCVLANDQRAFMQIRDEKMPIAVHLVLWISGLCVLILLGAAEYPTPAAGGVIIFVTAFAMSLYVFMIKDLQNPANSPWFVARIPPAWLEANVDVYFKTMAAPQQAAPTPQPPVRGASP